MGESDWYRVIALSLLGPPPLGDIHIPWEPGLQVLYGRNGAGKTRLLDAIRSLDGDSRQPDDGHAFVHIRYAPNSEFEEDWDLDGPLEEIAWSSCDAAVERYLTRAGLFPDETLLDSNLLDFLQSDWRSHQLGTVVTRAASVQHLSAARHLQQDQISEVVRARSLSLSPSGEVWVSSPITNETPLLQSGRDELRRRLSESKHPSEILLRNNPFRLTVEHEFPPSIPVPLVHLTSGGPKQLVRILGSPTEDPEAITNEVLMALATRAGAVTAHDRELVHVGEALMKALDDIGQRASSIAADMLQDAPELRLSLVEPAQWPRGKMVTWTAFDSMSRTWLPLDALSGAQRKWVGVAIGIATSEASSEPVPASHSAFIIDEPEEALHPAALDYLLQDLKATSIHIGGPVLLASHSAQVLSYPGARLKHIQRDFDGRARVNTLSVASAHGLEDSADRLGIRPIDFLQLYRVFLVVEGLHDSTVLRSLFDDQWEDGRILIVHMRGSSHVLDLASSEILRDFTDAHLVVLLDDMDSWFVEGMAAARELALGGRESDAQRSLQDLSSSAGQSEQKAIALARNFVDRPQNLHVRGLSKKDIIEYLDPGFFDLEEEWVALRKEFSGIKSSDFKDWLRESRGAKINEGRIAEAAASLADRPPAEMTELLDFCLELSTGSKQILTDDEPR